ncbi:kinase-like domain-containing protein [Rhizophagus clarus]|uniref:Kinase-like domain-containing protein n=1 Tax=Rhizophagus clarus TaxID=94130 RepID=A0A8H3QJ11_9GLOM|nr:kinase-like domain-containing protein [Rhizophagus clarus]
MASIRNKLVSEAINKAYLLIDYDNDLEGQYESAKRIINDDESLNDNEKSEAINILSKNFDGFKILDNEGKRRTCEDCHKECLATFYCENCVRNYLKKNFTKWTSENINIDTLIQKCQSETVSPDKIIEWIPYSKLQNIKYSTKGGCSEIYTADWIDGRYEEWDSKEKQLKRFGTHEVILKKLGNIESANRHWFDETRSHFTINNKYGSIVQCYGLTKDLDENYMLVVNKMKMNLKEYLQQNYNKLTWKKRIKIVDDIVFALSNIHREKAIHRDLHSGNILFDENSQIFYISDLGFCGPVDMPLDSIYGNLPYIAPEVIVGKKTTFKSDIYSIGMLMWEISSGRPPFINFDHNYDLAMKIINGMRPKIVSGTPLEYKKIMEQCWDADETKRPDISHLDNEIFEINKLYQQNDDDERLNVLNLNDTNISASSTNSLISSFSKIHIYGEMPEPRNFTKEEQEAYYSGQNDLSIPDKSKGIEDITSLKHDFKVISDKDIEVKNESKRIYSNNLDNDENFKKTKLSEDKGKQINNEIEFQYVRTNYATNVMNDDDDDTYNDPNLHSEEQDELEIVED